MRPVLVADSLWLGDWRCIGERKPWTREVTHHVAIELQRSGSHARELGRDRWVVDPTMVAIHAANDEYRMASPTAHPQRGTMLLVGDDLADELGHVTGSVRAIEPHVALLHRRVTTELDPVAREELALALAHQIIDATPIRRAPVRASWHRIADDIRHVIATRHRERLTLDLLAGSSGVSTFHACRAFRAVTGDSVHRHLRRVRLRVALYELESGDVSRAALEAGFSSHSHFTSAFRSEFGTTPSGMLRPCCASSRS